MNIQELVQQAAGSRAQYAAFEKEHYGREWNNEEVYASLVSDIGDLGRLVLAKEGVEDVPDVREKLLHELGECLWGIAVLAHEYNIDLEEAFQKQMQNVRMIREG